MCGRFAMPIGPRASSIVIGRRTRKGLDEDAHRRAASHDRRPCRPSRRRRLSRPSCAHSLARVCRTGRRSISSAMAKEVLAPVPLVIMTSRTLSDGRSTSIGRSLRRGIGAGPALADARAGRGRTRRRIRPGSARRPVGRERVGRRAIVMRIADDERAVGALHDDQVHAVVELRGLLGVEALASAPPLPAAPHSPGSGPGRDRT